MTPRLTVLRLRCPAVGCGRLVGVRRYPSGRIGPVAHQHPSGSGCRGTRETVGAEMGQRVDLWALRRGRRREARRKMRREEGRD